MSPHIDSSTKIKVYELEKNDESLFKEFIKNIEKEANLFKDLARTIRIIEETANLKRYPKTKFRLLKGHRLNVKVYEAKAGSIRVYLFQEKPLGRIIVTGGKKSNQSRDLKAVYKLIKDYYNE